MRRIVEWKISSVEVRRRSKEAKGHDHLSSKAEGRREEKSREKAHLVFRLPERLVDIVFRLPNPRHTLLVVSEPLLERGPQFAQKDSVGRLLVDLRSKSEPRTTSKSSEGSDVFGLGAVET